MLREGGDPSQLIQDQNLQLVDDAAALQKVVQQVLAENPSAIKDFKLGKAQAAQFLVGQIMKQTKGRAEPKKAREVLTKLLEQV